MKGNSLRRQRSSASLKATPEKKSGFKSFTSFPVFGGRTFAKSIPSVDVLQVQVFKDTEHTIVIGTDSIRANPNESRWKLSDNDQKLLKALFSKYEELEPLYNQLSPSARNQWDNRLICAKALYCLNAIRRTQGQLALRARDRSTSGILTLSKGLSAFEDGTREIVKRIGTETDLMWGWWFRENPGAGRSQDLMQAVEVVKSALQSASDLDSLARESPTIRILRASFLNLAVTAVREFEARWLGVFPITIESLVESNFFKNVLEDTSDAEHESLDQRPTEDGKMDESEASGEDEVMDKLDRSSKDEDESDQDAYVPSPPPEKSSSARKAKQKPQQSKPAGRQSIRSTPTAPRDRGANRRASSAKDHIQQDEAPDKPVPVKLKLLPPQDNQEVEKGAYEDEEALSPMDVDSHTRTVTSVLAIPSEGPGEESMGFTTPKSAANASEPEEGMFDEALEDVVAALQGLGDEGKKVVTVKGFLRGCMRMITDAEEAKAG